MDEELEDENEEKRHGKHVFKVFGCSHHKERYKDVRAGIGLPDRCYRLDMSPQRRYTRKLWTKGSNMKWCMLSDVVGLCLRAGV